MRQKIQLWKFITVDASASEKAEQGGSTSRLKSEMERYESYSYAHRHCNILYWWKTNEALFPLLAKICSHNLDNTIQLSKK